MFSLVVQARPVGVSGLFYWAGGAVGAAVMQAQWSAAAHILEEFAMGGEEGGAAAEGGNSGGRDVFGCWAARDGIMTVNVDDVRAHGSLIVGEDGGGMAAGTTYVCVGVCQ